MAKAPRIRVYLGVVVYDSALTASTKYPAYTITSSLMSDQTFRTSLAEFVSLDSKVLVF